MPGNTRFNLLVSIQVKRDLHAGRGLDLSIGDHYKVARFVVARGLVDPHGGPNSALQAVADWQQDKRYYDRVPFIGFDAYGDVITPEALKAAAEYLQEEAARERAKNGL